MMVRRVLVSSEARSEEAVAVGEKWRVELWGSPEGCWRRRLMAEEVCGGGACSYGAGTF